MNVYMDESGSVNRKLPEECDFVIAMIRVKNTGELSRAYKRFVSSNFKRLKELDTEKLSDSGRVIKRGGKMFRDGKFRELKGNQFDPEMKRKFVKFFSAKKYFEIFIVRVDNQRLPEEFSENPSRLFNYLVKESLSCYIESGLIPDENCFMLLDERNESAATRTFLEEYISTEFLFDGVSSSKFTVRYTDSADDKFVQIADVFANLYYSNLITGEYDKEIKYLKDQTILRHVFEFPENSY